MRLGDYANGGSKFRRFRRSLRKIASVPVCLRDEQQGRFWEEETETLDLSRHGAGLRCRHHVQTETTVVIIRKDNGRRANARVKYSMYMSDGNRELGLEFIETDNFWDLDWNSSQTAPTKLTLQPPPREVPVVTAPSRADRVSRGLVARTSVFPPNEEAGEVVLAAPVRESPELAANAPLHVIGNSASHTSTLPVEAESQIVEVVPRPVTGDSAAAICVLSAQDLAEIPQIASFSNAYEYVADRNTPPILGQSEIVEIASNLVMDEIGTDTIASLIQEAVRVIATTPSLVTAESAAETDLPPVQERTEVPQVISLSNADDNAADKNTPPVETESEIVGIARRHHMDEPTTDETASLGPEAVRVRVIAPRLVGGDYAQETSLTPVRELEKVPQNSPFPSREDNGAGARIPPVQAESGTKENVPNLVMDGIPGDSITSAANVPVTNEVPQTLPAACLNQEHPSTSFLSYYGLSGQPFDVTPDPDYLYLSETHREAHTLLAQGIQNLRGFMTLVAKPGMGKTTLLNKLMEDLRDSTRIAFLFQTQCNSRQFLRYLLNELGVDGAGKDVVAMHNALNEILFYEMVNGRRFVLIIDEAQNLHDSVLETIRLLSDFETTHSKLIQIVLSGQPALVNTLLRPSLSQLRQRIAILTSLRPLGPTDTTRYVDHRLRTAGLTGNSIFTPEALTFVADRSRGIPRIINNLCFNALLLGSSQGSNPIDIEIVRAVAANLDLESLARLSH